MTKLDQIKDRYNVALERYRVTNPVLHPADFRKLHICGLCGASVNGNELTEHMQRHELTPNPTLTYMLTESFRRVNGKIAKGAKFIKLLWIVSTNTSEEFPFGRAESVPYNALSLPDWSKLQDPDSVTIRWSAKKKRFIRTLWIIAILIMLTF